jgi:hypothetical protein
VLNDPEPAGRRGGGCRVLISSLLCSAFDIDLAIHTHTQSPRVVARDYTTRYILRTLIRPDDAAAAAGTCAWTCTNM